MKKLILIFTSVILMTIPIGCSINNNYYTEPSSQSESNKDEKEISDTVSQSEEQSVSNSQTDEPSISVSQTDEPSTVSQTEQKFTDINIEVSEGTLYIRSGNSFSLTYHDGKTLDYEITDGTLYISNSRTGDTVLTLPESESYKTLSINVGNGHLYGECPLNIENLNLDAGQGEATLKLLSVSDSSSIKVNKGSAFLSGDLGYTAVAEAQTGKISLEVPFKQTDCNYEINLSYGNITLGTESYHGKSDFKTIDNGAERSIKLTCAYGDISVEFGKN